MNGNANVAPVLVMVHWFVPALYVVVMPEPFVSVVVATHAGTPPLHASTCPPVPVPKNDDVAIAVGAARAPVPFARTVFAAIDAIEESASEPVTWVPRLSEPLIVERVEVAAA